MISAGTPVRPPLSSVEPFAVSPLLPYPPGWVQTLFDCTSLEPPTRAGCASAITAGRFSLFATVVPDAVSLAPGDLRRQVSEAYAVIADVLARDRRQPIRFWNFLPSPGAALGDGINRYMVFNQGRYDAYARWYRTPRAFSHSLATASAVGVASDDYVLYCLASDTPGVPVENPRQTPAWQYSSRYGPRPPCFARATVADISGTRSLLIGGTASIVGEDSVHPGNVDAQVDETQRNMSALIAAARGAANEPMEASLARMTDVRVYIRDLNHAGTIVAAIQRRCSSRATIEAALSAVCRPELLVEVEAIADL